MFCRKCGTKLVEGDSFCGSCGAPVIKKEEKKEEVKVEETKPVVEFEKEEKKESLVDFLSNEPPKKEHLGLPLEEKENDLERLLETPKTNIGVDDTLQTEEPKDNLVDLVIEEKPKVTPKVVEETEKDNEFTRTETPTTPNNNLVTFSENNNKKSNPILGIVLGIVGFLVAYVVVSMLFGNNPLDKFKKNTSTPTTTPPVVEKNVTYETKQLGELKYDMASTFSVYKETTQYVIYATEDSLCMISVATTPTSTHASADALIEASLNGSRDSVNGSYLPYSTNKREYNSIGWTHASTVITAQGINLYENLYVTDRNNNYYAMTFQSQGLNTDCTNYQAKIIRSAKFN